MKNSKRIDKIISTVSKNKIDNIIPITEYTLRLILEKVSEYATSDEKYKIFFNLPDKKQEFYPDDPDVDTAFEKGWNACLAQVKSSIKNS